MSRALSAIEEAPSFPFVDRAALMLDEGYVCNDIIDDFLDESGGSAATLDDYIGLPFMNPATGVEGILKKFPMPVAGQPVFYLDYPGEAGAGQVGGQRLLPGSLILDPRTKQSLTIGAGGMFTAQKLSDSDMRRLFGESWGGGTSYAPQAYGSTQAGQTQAEEAARRRQAAADAAAMERLEAELAAAEEEGDDQRIWQAEQNLIAAQNQLKLARLGEAGALQRQFEDIKARARDTIAEMMGKNPFRAAVRARGGVPRGVDPYEAFEAELGGVATMPTPQFTSESSLGQLESAIAAMQETQMPTSQWPMGMAGGGTVAPGEVVKVGELGEEYVYNRGPSTVDIIPNPRGARIAGRAQAGGNYDFTNVLGPAYAHLGFGFTPRYRAAEEPSGTLGYRARGLGGAKGLGMLGMRPRLLRVPGEGMHYLQDSELRPMTYDQFKDWGFRGKDVVSFGQPESFQAYLRNEGLTMGAPLTKAPSPIEPYPGGYPRQSIPLKLPAELGGYALPDPRMIANLFRTFDPENREILLDALGMSEMGRGQAASLMQAFTPRGTAGRVGFG